MDSGKTQRKGSAHKNAITHTLSLGLNRPQGDEKRGPNVEASFAVNLSVTYNKVVGHTYAVFGIAVSFIAAKPPRTSTKFSQPLDLRIDAAIILR